MKAALHILIFDSVSIHRILRSVDAWEL